MENREESNQNKRSSGRKTTHSTERKILWKKIKSIGSTEGLFKNKLSGHFFSKIFMFLVVNHI